jgi:hypothetical protein
MQLLRVAARAAADRQIIENGSSGTDVGIKEETMTSKSDFSPAEWELLRSAPVSVALAMSMADETGVIGFVREMMAGFEAAADQARDRDESPLFLELSTAWSEDEAEATINEEGRDRQLDAGDHQSLQTQALADASNAVAVLASQATPAEVASYKNLLLDVADAVMKESKSGGFLGIGGTQVTPGESTFYEMLRTRLAEA